MPFPLGHIVATPGTLSELKRAGQSPDAFLSRHAAGDWGEISEKDELANHNALREGGRILSSYLTHRGVKLWVITEADRSATTLLLPSEY
jgi:hypothetical protein